MSWSLLWLLLVPVVVFLLCLSIGYLARGELRRGTTVWGTSAFASIALGLAMIAVGCINGLMGLSGVTHG